MKSGTANEAMLEGARRWMMKHGFPDSKGDCDAMRLSALEFTNSRFPSPQARQALVILNPKRNQG